MDFKELRVKCMGNLGLGPCQHYHLPQRRFRMRIGAAQRCVWKAHRRVSEEQTLCGGAGARRGSAFAMSQQNGRKATLRWACASQADTQRLRARREKNERIGDG